jgi:hypothetical protein
MSDTTLDSAKPYLDHPVKAAWARFAFALFGSCIKCASREQFFMEEESTREKASPRLCTFLTRGTGNVVRVVRVLDD